MNSGLHFAPQQVFDAVVLDALRVQTKERKTQAERMRDTTRDAYAWNDYVRSVRYYEQILDLITEAERG